MATGKAAKFLWLALAAGAIAMLQLAGFFSVFGVKINALLIWLFITAFFAAEGVIGISALLAAVAAPIALALIFLQFWLPEFLGLAAGTVPVFALRKTLKGRRTLDFFTCFLAGCLLFYTALYLTGMRSFNVKRVLEEVAATAFLAAAVWSVIVSISKTNEKTGFQN